MSFWQCLKRHRWFVPSWPFFTNCVKNVSLLICQYETLWWYGSEHQNDTLWRKHVNITCFWHSSDTAVTCIWHTLGHFDSAYFDTPKVCQNNIFLYVCQKHVIFVSLICHTCVIHVSQTCHCCVINMSKGLVGILLYDIHIYIYIYILHFLYIYIYISFTIRYFQTENNLQKESSKGL